MYTPLWVINYYFYRDNSLTKKLSDKNIFTLVKNTFLFYFFIMKTFSAFIIGYLLKHFRKFYKFIIFLSNIKYYVLNLCYIVCDKLSE